MGQRFVLVGILGVAILAGCTNHSEPVLPASSAFAFHRAASPATLELDAGSSGPAVSADSYGASLDTWYDFVQPFVDPSLHRTGIHLVRFPGGSESDLYHWENGGSICVPSMGYIVPQSTFDNLMRHVAKPLNIDIAITLDYGSNRTCNGGGEPSEAGAWVAYAKQHGYRVAYWTVGNEVYGSWEYDLHKNKHDPYTYSNAVRTGYYPAVKRADPNAKLGIVVDTPNDHTWNSVVLRHAAPFDFVELHYYPEFDTDNDAFLLGPAIANFAKDLTGLRAEMTAAGVSKNVPIYLGEFNADAGTEGKQSVSIVNGLFTGQMLGTLLEAGVPMATWWVAYGSCDGQGDYASTLYGWQHFGSEALFSDALPSAQEGCSNTPSIPGGTPFPTGRVMEVMAQAIPAGSHVRTVTAPSSLTPSVRAYGFAVGNGYVFALFNNTLEAIPVQARLHGAKRTAFSSTLTTYGKAQYDRSREDRWIGAVTKSLGRTTSSIPLVLPPYSVSIVSLQ